MNFLWKTNPLSPSRFTLAEAAKVQPLTAQILLTRGVDSPEKVSDFLKPNLRHLHDPFLIPNMERAARRIVKAVRDKDTICIMGDYDADGVTGTVILSQTIKMLGGTVGYYIPSREEGYGLHEQSLRDVIEAGARLIVSVDCGITAIEPAKVCRELGVDLIITDHHEASDSGGFPDCYAIVHPRYRVSSLNGINYHFDKYPNPHICGAGVAFQLALAIAKTMNDGSNVAADYKQFFVEALAFAALGTIADVVPLVGENRVIAHFGMTRMSTTVFDGLRALIASAHLDGKDVTGYNVGFSLAPRINAAGRMGHASLAVKMLASENYTEALTIAEGLEQQNIERQTTERKILKAAEKQVVELQAAGRPTELIIVGDKTWHPGIVGIVASRISEKYHRPSIVLSGDGGSGRSVDGFSIIDALHPSKHLLTRYGGHNAACGLHLVAGKLEEFREAVCAYTREHTTPEMRQPTIHVEAEATLAEMSVNFVTELNKLGPFGNGNRKPYFLFKQLHISNIRRIGKEEQYLMFFGRQNEIVMKLISFKPNTEWFKLFEGSVINAVCEPVLNEYRGNISVDLQIRDLRLDKEDSSLYSVRQ